jgi:uncharacterized protein YbcI
MKINNAVNQELFGVGLQWQKVEFFGDHVLIQAKNHRVRALSALDGKDNMTTRLIDIALLVEYKERFRKSFEEEMGLQVVALLKDYEPSVELAFMLILLDRPVEEAIAEL